MPLTIAPLSPINVIGAEDVPETVTLMDSTYVPASTSTVDPAGTVLAAC